MGAPVNFYARPPTVSNDVILYLSFDGSNGSQVFRDGSAYNHTVSIDTSGTRETVISTTQSVFGGSSCFFEGTQSALLVNGHSVFDFGYDKTIECYFRIDSLTAGGNYTFFNWQSPGGNLIRYGLEQNALGTNEFWLEFRFVNFGATPDYTLNSGTFAINLGSWHHFAMSFNTVSNEVILYKDFVSIQSGTNTAPITAIEYTAPVAIGYHGFDGGDWTPNGYIDNFVVYNTIRTPGGQPVNFYARPPVVPDLTANTLLYLPGDSDFTDLTGRHTVSVSSATIDNTTYYLGTGAMYFNGVDNYLEFPDSLDWSPSTYTDPTPNQFMIDFFVYLTSTHGGYIFSHTFSDQQFFYFGLLYGTGGVPSSPTPRWFGWYNVAPGVGGFGWQQAIDVSLTTGAWHRITLLASNLTSVNFLLDGVSFGTFTPVLTYYVDISTTLMLGKVSFINYFFEGCIDNFRWLNKAVFDDVVKPVNFYSLP